MLKLLDSSFSSRSIPVKVYAGEHIREEVSRNSIEPLLEVLAHAPRELILNWLSSLGLVPLVLTYFQGRYLPHIPLNIDEQCLKVLEELNRSYYSDLSALRQLSIKYVMSTGRPLLFYNIATGRIELPLLGRIIELYQEEPANPYTYAEKSSIEEKIRNSILRKIQEINSLYEGAVTYSENSPLHLELMPTTYNYLQYGEAHIPIIFLGYVPPRAETLEVTSGLHLIKRLNPAVTVPINNVNNIEQTIRGTLEEELLNYYNQLLSPIYELLKSYEEYLKKHGQTLKLSELRLGADEVRLELEQDLNKYSISKLKQLLVTRPLYLHTYGTDLEMKFILESPLALLLPILPMEHEKNITYISSLILNMCSRLLSEEHVDLVRTFFRLASLLRNRNRLPIQDFLSDVTISVVPRSRLYSEYMFSKAPTLYRSFMTVPTDAVDRLIKYLEQIYNPSNIYVGKSKNSKQALSYIEISEPVTEQMKEPKLIIVTGSNIGEIESKLRQVIEMLQNGELREMFILL